MEEKQAYCNGEAAEQVYENIFLIMDTIAKTPNQSDKLITPDNVLHKWWYQCKYVLKPIEEPCDSVRQEPEKELFGVKAYSFDLGETIRWGEATKRSFEYASFYPLAVISLLRGPKTKFEALQREATELRPEQRKVVDQSRLRVLELLKELGIENTFNEEQRVPEGLLDEYTMCHGVKKETTESS